jgi:hypothetical protein
MKPNGCVQRCFCQKAYGSLGMAKQCTQFVGKLRKVPSELLNMLFSSNLLASKRKEDKRMRIAAQVFDTGRDIVVDDGDGTMVPIPPVTAKPMTVGPYGDSSGIVMPQVSLRALQGMRRKGISPKRNYSSVRAQVVPTYTISRFIEDLKQSRHQKVEK